MKAIPDFLMGADPEFMVYNSKKEPVMADALIRKRNVKSVLVVPPYPECGDSSGRNVFTKDLMGRDGSGGPCELRPDPTRDPLQLVQNIAKILADSATGYGDMAELGWAAGASVSDFPLGGHIHFGIKLPNEEWSLERDLGRLLRSLDCYLSVPIMLIEGENEGKARRTRYGRASGYRQQLWGLEYRTPSSWLVSPHIAASVLCLAKVIMAEALGTPDLGKDTPDRIIVKIKMRAYHASTDRIEYATQELIQSCIDTNNFDHARSIIGGIWGRITEMKLYPFYKDYIDLIKYLIDNRLSWYPKGGMKRAWGIQTKIYPTPKQVSVRDLWKEE